MLLAPGETTDVEITHDGTIVHDDLLIASDDPINPELSIPIDGGSRDLPIEGSLYFNRANDFDIGEVARYSFRGPSQRLLGGTPCIGCHAPSPDERFLISDSTMAPFSHSAFDRDTGLELQLVHPLDDPINLSFNPDPNTDPPYLYVFSAGGDLHLGSLAAGYLGLLAGADDPNLIEGFPSWGSAGEIAFVRGERYATDPFQMMGPLDILLIGEAGGTPRAIAVASNNGRASYYPDFAPGGRHLAFTVSDEVVTRVTTFAAPDAQIRIADLSNGTLLDLAAANGADGSSSMARFSKDGRYLAFSSDRSGSLGGYDLYVAPFDPETGLDQTAIPLSAINTALSEHFPAWGR
jgi:hypothetical protein